ncbi:MAG: glutamate--cysteine ligase [Nitrosomonadales bacterium]|nr:glutamate--cysteine ligase [Nitrosomonadales bacterium]
MIPILKTELSSELFDLENYIIHHSCDIEHWFRTQWLDHDAPFYASVDLRNSGFKLAPVDTNLFPGGFNNLNPDFAPLTIQAISVAIEKVCPDAWRVLIIPENHTRNIFYLKNIFELTEILKNSGLEVRIGNMDPNINKIQKIKIDDKNEIKIEPIHRENDRLFIKNSDSTTFRPCAIILNNDLSGGVPDKLKNLDQNIIPPISAGWPTRRKSIHFKFYNEVVEEFCKFTKIDSWLINPLFEKLGGLNFLEREGEIELSKQVAKLLLKIKEKYSQYNITQEPYVVIKADVGTYGMGIMTIKNSEDVINLNRKIRKKMSVVKEGLKVTEVIIQEGIHTEETVNEAVAEPVVYMIDHFVVGGFYRIHTNKEKDENLNSPGMHFVPVAFETSCLMPDQGRPCDDKANRFYAYGVIARLALLAAAKELQN